MARVPIKFVAPLIRAAIATLKDEMPDQVAIFNAEPANDVEIVEPQTYWFGGNDLLGASPFPQVEVAAVAGHFGNFTVGRATGDHDVRVNVAIWVEGAVGGGDIPTLYQQVMGLQRCVIECLVPDGAFGGGVEIAQDVGVSWRNDVIPVDATFQTPAEGRPFQRWLGSGLIQFRVEAPPEVFA